MLQHNLNALNAKLNSSFISFTFRGKISSHVAAYITGKALEHQDIKYQNNNNY